MVNAVGPCGRMLSTFSREVLMTKVRVAMMQYRVTLLESLALLFTTQVGVSSRSSASPKATCKQQHNHFTVEQYKINETIDSGKVSIFAFATVDLFWLKNNPVN